MKISVLALLFLLVSVNLSAQSVSTNKQVYLVDEPILVNYSGMPDFDGNWIAVSRADAATNSKTYIQFFYLYDSRSGNLTFDALIPGDYEVRVYYDWPRAGYSVRIRKPFKVILPQNVSLITKDTYEANEPIVIEYENMPGNDEDWICVSEATSPTNDITYIEYTYMKGLPINGTHEFKGLTPGNYEIRAYWDYARGGYETLLTRQGFSVIDSSVVEKVQFVKKVEGTFNPVGDEVIYGDSLYIEVIFTSEPIDDIRDVSLILGGRTIDTITVYKTENPRIFRSQDFVIAEPEWINDGEDVTL